MNETTKEVSTTVEAKCFYDIPVVERETKGNDSPFFTRPSSFHETDGNRNNSTET